MIRTTATWVLRVLWFVLPLTVGQAVDEALVDASDSVAQTMMVGLWALWAIGTIAVAVPVPASLTAVRSLSPTLVIVAVWALAVEGVTGLTIAAVAHALVTMVAAMNQLVGDRFVDGASYGDERRMLLRPPTQLLATAVPLAWLVAAAGLATGPLLLADKRWIIGAVTAAIGVVAVPLGIRALHQLSLRWIVFVPTGFVLHDHVVLTEPVLFRRTAVERIGPAIAGTPARDLSNGAAGLLLECELADAAPLGLRETSPRANQVATMTDIRRFMFSPTRPGELLDEADRRRLPVG